MTSSTESIFRELPQYQALWNAVWSRKKTVFRIAAAVTAVMLVYVLVMPQSFTSTTTLLPPQQEKSNMGLASLLSGGGIPLMDISSSLGFGSRPSDLFVQVLNSRTVADSLIITERLDKFFGVDDMGSHRFALEPLQEATEIDANKDGIITISVTLKTGFFAGRDEIDSVKRFAARIANRYVYWLDRVNREKLISRARQSREFIASELVRTQEELDTAFNQLVAFQERNKSIYLEKQTEAALEGASSLKDKLYRAQLELALKKQDFKESSRVIKELESEVNQLQQLYQSMDTPAKNSGQDFYVPFSKLPRVAQRMADLLRKVKTLEQVMLFLSQQFYQERVQEAKDTPTVQVLDEAVPAILRSSPKRALWMALTVFFSLIASVLYVLATQRPHTPRNEPEHQGRAQTTGP